MTVIKRYPNRKLYDTEAKQYITLDGIAELIRQGKEVSVIDHASGEDQTTLTLTQIIVEQEKKHGGLMPRAILAGLIQSGGGRISGLQRILASPLTILHQFDEEARRRIQELVKKGEMSEREGQKVLEKLLSFSSKAAPTPETEIERILLERNVPTREDVQKLAEQLESLAAKLDEIELSR